MHSEKGGWQDFWDQCTTWQQETLGNRGSKGPLAHLAKEVVEIQNNPRDLEEYADAVFMIINALYNEGFTFWDLLQACWKKLEINKLRSWPKPSADNLDKPIEHIKE